MAANSPTTLTLFSGSLDYALSPSNGDRMGVTLSDAPVVLKGESMTPLEPEALCGEHVLITKSDLILISFDGKNWFELLNRATFWGYRLFTITGNVKVIVNRIDNGDPNPTQPPYFCYKLSNNCGAFKFEQHENENG